MVVRWGWVVWCSDCGVCGCEHCSALSQSHVLGALPHFSCSVPFICLWILAPGAGRSWEHPEMGSLWEASPGAGAQHHQGHSQDQCGAGAEAAAAPAPGTIPSSTGEGAQSGPCSSGQPCSFISLFQFISSAPQTRLSPSLQPQISARQRLKIPEIKSARLRPHTGCCSPGWGARCRELAVPEGSRWSSSPLRLSKHRAQGQRCQRCTRALTARAHFAGDCGWSQ